MSLLRFVPLNAFRLGVLLIAGLAATSGAGGQAAIKPRLENRDQPSAKATERALPLVFEENAGQLPEGSAFVGRARNYTVELHATELRFEMTGKDARRTIHVEFEGTKGGQPAGMSEANFRTNVYLGNDPRRWRTGIRNFDRVALQKLYPGIDAEFYSRGGEIEHDFMLAPGADAGLLTMRLSGAATMELSAAGDVVLGSEDGSLRLRKPEAYQVLADGRHQAVDAAFAMATRGHEAELRFKLGEYDHSRALVIDPVISYATYVAGSAGSTPSAVAADAAGNVYVTGYTGSTEASFAAAAGGGTGDPTAPILTTFIAKLAAAVSGSQIAWVTYYGSPTGSTQSTAIALQPAGSTVYVGGTVADGALPTGGTATFDSVPAAGAAEYGFVGTFATGTGLFAAGTYIEGGQTIPGGMSAVTGLAVSPAGAVTIVGYTTGNLFTTSTSPAPLIATNDPSVQSPTVTKGVLLTLDQPLVNELYGTYVCGDTCLTLNTYLTGVAVDPTGNIYISGYTPGDFPQAGQYIAANPTATPPVAASAPPMNMPPVGKVGADAFAAQIIPSTQTVGYSFWSGGTGNDVANGLALNLGESDLYLFGSTSSIDLVTNAATTSGMTKDTTVSTPLDANYPAAATTSGFLAHVDVTGQLVATTYLGGSYTSATASSTATSASSATLDGAGNLYVAGYTSAAKAGFPQQTSGAVTTAVTGVPLLPLAEDVSMDSTAGAPLNRGYLVEMPSSLSTVTYLANLGPSSGSSMAVGVAVDGAASPNAYVLLQDMPTTGGASFTTASAAQQLPQITTAASAYVAQIAFAPAQSSPAIAAGTDSSSPNPIYYQTTVTPLGVTLTWNIVGSSATGANGLVFNLPYSANLVTYAAVPTVTVGGTAVQGVCTLGVSSVANTSPGITCVVPGPLTQGVTAQFILSATLSAAATATTPFTFNVPAAAFDDQGDQLILTQSVTVTQAPTLTLTDTVSTNTANAVSNQGVADTTTPNRSVTYTYTITNTSSVDSPTTKLTANLPAGFQATGSTVSMAGCSDPTVNPCDVPANSSLVYTVTGVFLGSSLGATASGPFAETVTAPYVSFQPGAPYSPVYSSSSPATVSVQGNAQLSTTITASGYTYPAGSATGFTLGDTAATLVATITNSGPNQAGPGSTAPVAGGPGSVTIALPQGFSGTSFTGSPSNNFAGCTASGSTLTCLYTSLPGNSSLSINIVGSFTDTGTASDAVPPPATSPTPTQATVANSPTFGTVTAQVSGLAVGAGTYAPAPTYGSALSARVTRVNVLSYAVGETAPLALNTVNATNSQDISDFVTYTATVTNSGQSVARGVFFTIALPAPSGAATNFTVDPIFGVRTTPSAAASPANYLSCAAYHPGDTQLTCYQSDLTATPTAASTTPATFTVTFHGKFSELTVPVTVSSATVQEGVTGAAYSASRSQIADNTVSATAGAFSPTSVTVQRSTQLVEALSYTIVGAAPAAYENSSLNLAEFGTGTTPGVHDTINLTLQTWNVGPNDAAGVSVKYVLPDYFQLISTVPSGCTLTGPNPTVGGGSTSLTCTMPVPAVNPQIQLLNCALGCSATNAPTGAGQLYVLPNLMGKFVDNGTSPDAVSQTLKSSSAATGIATATGVDVDPYTTNTATGSVTVQRAAHIKLASAVAVTYTDNTATTVAGQESALAGGSGTVFNCIRYAFTVTNTGVNIANQPALTYGTDFLPPVGFHVTGMAPGVPPAFQPVNCSGDVAANPVIGSVSPGAIQSYYVDGYFAKGTLVGVNSLAESATVKSFTHNYYYDTAPASNPVTEVGTGGFSNVQSVTVVNTPFNNGLTGAFTVSPIYLSPCSTSRPAVVLKFTNVSSAGITTPCTATTTTATLPMGTSPNPPDKGAKVTLYQTGVAPVYYNVQTTAALPTTAGNSTQVCVVPTTSLPDVFVKPERALLWVLLNGPTGTTYHNDIVGITSTGPLAGDITTSVASSGSVYLKVPAAITFPQVPQAQPGQVCGAVNGFITGGTGTTFAVLEPVNFPPYVVAGSTAVGVSSKGVSFGLNQLYLLKSPTQTHDFNDSDPCYIAGARTKCDDNPYLYAFIFGGGNTTTSPEFTGPALVSSLVADPTAAANAYDVGLSLNITGGTQAYVAVADQATGADLNNDKIVGTNYTANPFTTQGGFLTGNSTVGFPVCDPGLASGTYTLTPSASVTRLCQAVPDSTTVAPTERYVVAGSPYIVGNVGAAAVTGSSSVGSGLILLPYPVDFTTSPPTNPPSAAAPAPAVGYVTPGQTVGFAWGWLNSVVVKPVAPAAAPTYTLTCTAITSLTNNTPVSLPAGTTCHISTPDPNAPTSTTFSYSSAAYIPTILVVTTGNSFAMNVAPLQGWHRVLGEVMAAMLLPVLFFRRRLGGGTVRLLAILLTVATIPLISGCSTAGSSAASPNVTPSGTYYLIVTATPSNPSLPTITSAAFEVIVQKAN